MEFRFFDATVCHPIMKSLSGDLAPRTGGGEGGCWWQSRANPALVLMTAGQIKDRTDEERRWKQCVRNTPDHYPGSLFVPRSPAGTSSPKRFPLKRLRIRYLLAPEAPPIKK